MKKYVAPHLEAEFVKKQSIMDLIEIGSDVDMPMDEEDEEA